MSPPSIPDPNKAAVQGAISSAENYPFEYIINQLAQTGGTGTVNGQTYDFTGLGTADQAQTVSSQEAQALLDIQNNFGPQFVQQRLSDLQQADPAGFAARQQLYQQILAESQQAPPNAQMSQSLQDSVNGLLSTAGQLTTGPNSELEAVQQNVRGGQLNRGIYLGNAPAAQEAAAVEQAGEQKRSAVQSEAANFLASGTTPEDIQYRQIQQSLANLGAFQNGVTPQAEFGSLSGAQGGAAPFTTNYSNPASINQNSALQGILNQNQLYSGQVNWAQSQMNPYLAGLSSITSGVNTLAGLYGTGGGGSSTANFNVTGNAGTDAALNPILSGNFFGG